MVGATILAALRRRVNFARTARTVSTPARSSRARRPRPAGINRGSDEIAAKVLFPAAHLRSSNAPVVRR
jgi:hypothetical protein